MSTKKRLILVFLMRIDGLNIIFNKTIPILRFVSILILFFKRKIDSHSYAKILLFASMFLCFEPSVNLMAQKKEADSLDNLLKVHSGETKERVDLLKKAAKRHYNAGSDKALVYSKEAEQLAEKLNLPDDLAEMLSLNGFFYRQKGEIDVSLNYYKRSLEVYRKENKLDYVAGCYHNIGNVYLSQMDYVNALSFYNEAVEILNKANNASQMSRSYNNISIVYLRQSNYDEALKYAKRTVALRETGKRDVGLAKAYSNTGAIYETLNDYTNALEQYQKAFDIYKEINKPMGMALCYNNIGKVLSSQNNYPKAFESFHKAIKLYKSGDNNKGITNSYDFMGIAYKNQANYTKALEFYQKSLDLKKQAGYLKDLSSSYNNIGNVYEYMGDSPKALEYYEKALAEFIKYSDNRGLAKCYNNIGIVYKNMGDYTKALDYYQKSLKIKEKRSDEKGIAVNYINMGIIYENQGNYPTALDFLQKALATFEMLEDKSGIAECYVNLGTLYKNLKEYTKSLDFFEKSLHIFEQIKNKSGVSECYLNLGIIYKNQGLYEKALEFFGKSKQIDEDSGDISRIARCYMNIGVVNKKMEDYKGAFRFIQKALDISLKIKDKLREAESYKEFASVYFLQKHFAKAKSYSQKAYEMANEIGEARITQESVELLAQSNRALGNYKEAYDMHVIAKAMNDSLFNEENTKELIAAEYKYKYEKEKRIAELEQQKKAAIQEEKMATQRIVRNVALFGAVVLIIFLTVVLLGLYKQRKANKKLAEQKQIISDTNEELQNMIETVNAKNIEINKQHKIVTKQKEQITESISYARRIQSAVLPSEKLKKTILPEHFVFFKPRDIVSGDFYWMQKIKNRLMVATADCTGHGVPGAFMSMLGISLLNEIVRNNDVEKPSEILEMLRERVKETLNQTGIEKEAKEGIDLAFYSIDMDSNKLQFSGANNPLYIFKQKQLLEYKADKQPVGIHCHEYPFSNQEIQLEKGDSLYTFSDGFIDQQGGAKGRKFLTKQFKEVLVEIQEKNMDEQKLVLETIFNDWQGKSEQIDDVLVIGIKV